MRVQFAQIPVDSVMKGKIIFDTKLVALLVGISIASFLSLALLYDDEAQTLAYDGPLKAAIIDQLHSEMPNVNFQQKASEYLETAGYEVDIFTTEDITVDFYKNLPSMNYQFVVLRTHSIGNDKNSQDSVMLFTGERYTEDKYIGEQLAGQVQKGTPLLEMAFVVGTQDSELWVENNGTKILKISAKVISSAKDEFFVVTPKLVKEAMVGKFANTIFLLGGCETLANPSLAEALMDRGASGVVGWDNTVSSMDNDRFLLLMLKTMLTKNMGIKDALEDMQGSFHPESMAFPANFTYYSNGKI